MAKFNINKLRSAGLRYLVVDTDGQAWAFEPRPVRHDGHWSLPAEFLPPETRVCTSINPDGTLHISEMENADMYYAYWRKMMRRCHWLGREIAMPVSDVPIDLRWEDEPYDIIEHGLVLAEDFKIWPEI